MALTFRDFFRGIAESAPMMADLVYKQVLYNNQTEMQERQMAMEEKRTDAYIESMDESTRLTGMQADELKALMPYKIAIEKDNADMARISKLMVEGEYKAIQKIPDFYGKQKRDEMALRAEQLNSLKSSIRSSDAQAHLAELQAVMAKNQMLQDSLFIALDSAENPQSREAIAQIWEQATTNGYPDFMKFVEGMNGAGEDIVNPTLRKSINDISMAMYNVQSQYTMSVNGEVGKLRGMVLDPKKENNSVRESLGLNGNARKNKIEDINYALEQQRNNWMQVPFIHQVNQITSKFDSYLGYNEEESQPFQFEMPDYLNVKGTPQGFYDLSYGQPIEYPIQATQEPQSMYTAPQTTGEFGEAERRTLTAPYGR